MKGSPRTQPLLSVCKNVTVGHVGTTSKHYADNGVALIRTQNVTANGLDLSDVRYITNEFHRRIQKSSVEPGDLLLTRVVTDEVKCAIAPQDVTPANCANVILIRPSDNLLPEYLRYLIASPASQNYLLGKRVGSAQQVVNTKILKDWLVQIPEIAEQKRIVAILDQAFADIDKARALTEQNLKNARELFESTLQHVFDQRGEGWRTQPLESIAEIVNGYAFKSRDFSETYSAKVIKITNVGTYEFVESPGVFLPDQFLSTHSRFTAKQGDVVIALTRTIISSGLKVAVVPATYDGALVNQRVAAVKVDESVMPKEMLQAFLSTRMAIDYVRSNVTELMQPNLSIKDLRAFPIPIPPREKKDAVMKKVAEVKELTSLLNSTYQLKLARLNALKKSLLQKAFSGELTQGHTEAAA